MIRPKPTQAAPRTPTTAMPTPRAAEPTPRPSERGPHSRSLHIIIERPDTGLSLVRLRGEIDLSSTERLSELIRQRMTAAALHALVLDLTGVTFCSSCGIELLVQAQCRAENRGIALHVVPGTGGVVARMLELTDVSERFWLYSSPSRALAAARR